MFVALGVRFCPFSPVTEIGWRIASQHWNKGYATEAAKAVLHYALMYCI